MKVNEEKGPPEKRKGGYKRRNPKSKKAKEGRLEDKTKWKGGQRRRT
jgi:hypothetical protein